MGVTDLPDDLQKKLLKWEANKPENRSVRALEDIASMTQGVLDVLSEKPDDTATKEMGAVLVDMRESLMAIKNKETPDMPDFSKPVLEGLQKLEKAFSTSLGKIDVKPEFKPNIQVQSPSVRVDAPEVDMSGVKEVLRSDIPRAFREAMSLVPVAPETDFSSLENLLTQMSEQLDSIDTASRMKPQFPLTMKVTNPDGSGIGNVEPTLAVRIDDVTTADTTYIGKASIGSTPSLPVWQIAKLDTSSGLVKTWAVGSASYSNVWDDRATTITYT